ncbi:MAG TPA: VOC family protein [Polyangiaceae bacterium]|nr:VOC family protein [Polyangiaceae bacterium]
MNRFFKLTLRTSDVEAALAFYGAVLGPGSRDIVQLHEQAVARGARPHWLGFLEVEDVDATLLAFTRRGATRLSPTWVNPAGLQGATLRDPGGAVLGLARRPAKALDHELDAVALRPPGTRPDPDVVFCDLNTADVERAMANYTETFGWGMKDALDLGSLGTFHAFAWEPGRATVGSMSDVATRGVHPHWLFHFRVDSVDGAVAAVRDAGGVVVRAVTLPSGDRIAVCDDPQGAAFALRDRGASVLE